jgi:hypothetical protein
MTRPAALALALTFASPLAAQETPAPVAFTGEIGTSGELYNIRGRDARRPSTTGELYLRSTVALFGRIRTDVDLLISSEESAALSGTPGIARQRLNRFGLTPTWSWGRAYLGSFSDSYSSYTLSGLRVNGAGFTINPGLLRAASVVGTAAQPVLGGATDGSFRRRIIGGRLGVGRGRAGGTDGSFVDLMLLRAWDDERSLPVSESPLDPVAGIPVNTYAVTPEENVVAGAAGGLELLRGRLRLGGEASAALHSRDRRAPELDETTLPSYPGLLRTLLTPRVSTHADYAYRADATVRVARLPGGTPRAPRTLNVVAEYEHIGPGYVSLGVASLPVDQDAVGIRSQIRFPRWTLGLNGRTQRDNLIGQKLSTTHRVQLGALLTLRPTSSWTASFRGNLLDLSNNSNDSLRMVAYANHALGVVNTFAVRRSRLVRSVTVSYGYQDAGDENPRRADAALVSHTADVRVSLSPARILQLTPSVGIVRARAGAAPWNTRESYALAASARLLDGRWATTVAMGTSRAAPNRSTRVSLSSRFHLTAAQSVAFQVSLNRYRSPLEAGENFSESVVRIEMVRSLR